MAMTHRNPIRQDWNYNESAALIDAHLKRYMFRTEDDIVASSIDWINSDAFNDRRNCGENATDHCL